MIKTNQGSIKIATLLVSIVGVGAYFLTQTEEVTTSKNNVLSQVSGIQKSIEDTKVRYIDQPISIAIDSKKQLDEITSNKSEMTTSKILGEKTQSTNPSNSANNSTSINNSPTSASPQNIIQNQSQTSSQPQKILKQENLDKLTNQMVENCKVITEEYNNLKK